ncbi:hypothetical protein NDU88_006630 [Pleurodeles waltl]|uniref:Uncharacterized protein n=1 Tax=Pleurodeles waltl TaxID=8319 RepID=A0AAV7X0R8_PLEWA|nr:hypothetical protein NDU88_006630 [Pleurodeles waltl]
MNPPHATVDATSRNPGSPRTTEDDLSDGSWKERKTREHRKPVKTAIAGRNAKEILGARGRPLQCILEGAKNQEHCKPANSNRGTPLPSGRRKIVKKDLPSWGGR